MTSTHLKALRPLIQPPRSDAEPLACHSISLRFIGPHYERDSSDGSWTSNNL
ncbi:hypothetical protein BDQ94DRAFT_143216 [Aspergillus welwitschiae]|uniref:Uncharacterized protein n=1 Tax=Aspergillus welwitschiae TaxID=1341132 RepID=A0A3F3Q326_9EURO|nr:hypothetical protein BDQ94DRAFT_143216 [Aspergillus welwitschiae]RDH33505.1 hypothetical protein BDQ94DRAFT_143216 [Aspergillus welwitschiae]